MHYSVITFPGTTCDFDCIDAVAVYNSDSLSKLWYQDHKLPKTDCVIIPGGFTYGDYLRAGALAKTAPILKEVVEFANNGGLVIGICNGFQILTEVGLLPGALIKNTNIKFSCKDVHLKVLNNGTPFTGEFSANEIIQIPIAHSEGNYYTDQNTYNELMKNNQVVFKYCNSNGIEDSESNPNGSIGNIAGICNKKGNVLGMMPHPERNLDPLTGTCDGMKVFKSINQYISAHKKEYAGVK